MTLLITLVCAIVVTLIWYTSEKARKMKVEVLCYMFWGASIMWLCDAVSEYMEKGSEYFYPAKSDMINDTFLGLCVAVLGFIAWIIYLFVKDPYCVLRTTGKNLQRRK